MITDWDDAYQNGAYIPDADRYLPMWQAKAAAYRKANPPVQIAYGDHPRQIIDLFQPGNPKGLVVFVHGGYWHSLDRSFWSHLAAGAVQRGWAVAIPEYALCPEVSIADITQQIATAIDCVASKINGPVHLTGHSAGGHLVSRMGCDDVRLATAPRLKSITPISGIYDLRPLTHTNMNADLNLTKNSATNESPVFKTPRKGINLTCWVGSDERPEFLRQNQLLANIWTGCGIQTRSVTAKGQNHFSVISALEHPDSPLTSALVDVNQGGSP
ncbi:MAG: alpha/beta hydrolase [Rhodobacteraceae bacterium]|nr:alpha/beta hydrolase [Paracoccaceae bacterium]